MFGELLNKSVSLLVETNIIYPEGEEGAIDLSTLAQPSIWPSAIVIALCAALGLICIGLVVIVLLQKKRASGIGAAIAGSGETFWSKNKGKSAEGKLENYTKWGGIAFIVIALLINMFI